MRDQHRKRLWHALVPLALAGCATTAPPQPGSDHPANPGALEAPLTPASSALPSYRPAPRAGKNAAQPEANMNTLDHGSMQMDGMSAPEDKR